MLKSLKEESVDLENVFDEQVDVLIKKGYIEASGMDEKSYLYNVNFLRKSLPYILRDKLSLFPVEIDRPPYYKIPFLIVNPRSIVPLHKSLSFINGKSPNMAPQAFSFNPYEISIEKRGEFHVPYLIYGIDISGLGFAPGEDLDKIHKEGGFGLSLDEGVAFITFFPEILKKTALIMPGTIYSGYNDKITKSLFMDHDEYIYGEGDMIQFPFFDRQCNSEKDHILVNRIGLEDAGDSSGYWKSSFCAGRITHLDILNNPNIPDEIKYDK